MHTIVQAHTRIVQTIKVICADIWMGSNLYSVWEIKHLEGKSFRPFSIFSPIQIIMKAMCLTFHFNPQPLSKVEITIRAEDVYVFTLSKIASDGPNMYFIISFFCEQLMKWSFKMCLLQTLFHMEVTLLHFSVLHNSQMLD